MKWKSESTATKLTSISRFAILVIITLFAIATISLMTHGSIWLVGSLVTIGILLTSITMIVPGLLLIFRRPDLAYAWHRGTHPRIYRNIPWEKLPKDKNRLIYADSIISLFFAIAFIIWFISEQ